MKHVDESEKGCLLTMVGIAPWGILLVWSLTKGWGLIVGIWGDLVELLKKERG